MTRSLLTTATFVAVSLAGSWLCGGRALAEEPTLAALVAQLGAEDKALVQEAVSALGRRTEPAALHVLEALRDGKLSAGASGVVVIVRGEGELVDPVSGRSVAAESGGSPFKALTVNNAVRRVLGPALAELQLRSPDKAVRLAAAVSLRKSPDERIAPSMRGALEREADPAIQKLLVLALAQLDFSSDDPARRIASIEAMRESGDASFRVQLAALYEQNEAGGYREPDAEVREAARLAVISIERKEIFTRIVRDLFYGLSLGSVLLLAALGLAITFGLMRVINMAHGEMLMLGAYSSYAAQLVFQKYFPAAIDYYLVLALPLAFAVCMLVGIVLERSVIRFLYGRPLETLLATWGISLMLIQAVRLSFGAQNVSVANPSWLSGGFDLLPGVVLPYNRIAIVVFVTGVVLFVAFLLGRTRLGLQVRAITQNRAMAACMGIPTTRVDTLTFGLGSAIAGLGGVALSQLGNVGPELGQLYIVDSFMVVVVGGVGKVAGSVVAAVGLGVVNKVLEPFAGAVLGKILVLAFVVLFIQRRPQGLFALKGRSAEG